MVRDDDDDKDAEKKNWFMSIIYRCLHDNLGVILSNVCGSNDFERKCASMRIWCNTCTENAIYEFQTIQSDLTISSHKMQMSFDFVRFSVIPMWFFS